MIIKYNPVIRDNITESRNSMILKDLSNKIVLENSKVNKIKSKQIDLFNQNLTKFGISLKDEMTCYENLIKYS